MSLQIPVQKDIGEYDEKIVGKLTLRSAVCLGAGFLSAVGVAAFTHFVLGIDVSKATLPVMACALPFWLLGFCKPCGLPLEKFVVLYANHVLHAHPMTYRSCAALEAAQARESSQDKHRKRTRKEKRTFKKLGGEMYDPTKQAQQK
jgi:hypothetical protein